MNYDENKNNFNAEENKSENQSFFEDEKKDVSDEIISKETAEILLEEESIKTSKNKKSGFALKFLAMLLVAVIAGGASGAGTFLVLRNYSNKTESYESLNGGEKNEETTNIDIPSINLSAKDDSLNEEGVVTGITKVVNNVMPAMVSINVTVVTTVTGMWGQTQKYEGYSSGSGIISAQSDSLLYIITNHHVIDDAKSISITFSDGKSYQASIKGSDSDYDLAVLTIPLSSIDQDTLSVIKTAVLGSSDNLNLGEPAIAIGNALGYGQSVTVGYISATEREVQMEDKTMLLIQTDAAINPGNSGGALININGEVIGINSSKYSSTDVEGMGFAIPISKAIPIINEIINESAIPEDEQAYLGISGNTVNSSWVSAYGWPEGVYISAVTENSPADKGGLCAHDIITKFDSKTVKTIDSLTERLSKKRAGDTVEIVVMRQNNYGKFEEITLNIKLEAKKDS